MVSELVLSRRSNLTIVSSQCFKLSDIITGALCFSRPDCGVEETLLTTLCLAEILQ